jgi:hypothetical protein
MNGREFQAQCKPYIGALRRPKSLTALQFIQRNLMYYYEEKGYLFEFMEASTFTMVVRVSASSSSHIR